MAIIRLGSGSSVQLVTSSLQCGRAMLRHEWAGSTGVIPRPHRKPTTQEYSSSLPKQIGLYICITKTYLHHLIRNSNK
uniref:SFRICE_011924 n=1 Tax=Spodoptera frugiperda TaxID=7108 RepID=A0A2H1WQN9_SPOFR